MEIHKLSGVVSALTLLSATFFTLSLVGGEGAALGLILLNWVAVASAWIYAQESLLHDIAESKLMEEAVKR